MRERTGGQCSALLQCIDVLKTPTLFLLLIPSADNMLGASYMPGIIHVS